MYLLTRPVHGLSNSHRLFEALIVVTRITTHNTCCCVYAGSAGPPLKTKERAKKVLDAT